MTERITSKQFQASEGVEDWRAVGDGACGSFRTGSFSAGARLVRAISELPGIEAHAPDVDLRPTAVFVRLVTYSQDYYGLTRGDVELARMISSVARNLGIIADPRAAQSVHVAIDAVDLPKVMAFWRALLGYELRAESPEDLIDPNWRGAPIWFQKIDEPAQEGGNVHIDVWVPHDQAEARIAAALGAGGRLVTDKYAPRWWTLADPEGNLADVATIMNRD
jgi:4a-hydroxytetrahydrobiopterin dehydratase